MAYADVSDGQVLTGGSLNANFGGLILTQSLNKASEQTATTPYTVIGSFLIPNSGGTFLGFNLTGSAKTSNTSYTPQVVLSLSGTTLGTKWIGNKVHTYVGATLVGVTPTSGATPTLIYTLSGTYESVFAAAFAPVKMVDNNTVCSVNMQIGGGATATMSGLTVDIFYTYKSLTV